MENKEIMNLATSAWSEKVYIETTEHIITGNVYMPKIGKKSRLLTEMLNSNKNFIAVKDCTIDYKQYTGREVEKHSFIQVNISSILIMRPIENE